MPSINRPVVSKINWLAIIIAGVNMAAVAGYIPKDYVPHVLSVVNTAGPMLIVVMRTWFTEKAAV